MANLFEIVGEIAVEGVSQAQSKLKDLDRRAEGLSDTLNRAGDKMQSFGQGMANAGDKASMATGVIAGAGFAAGRMVTSVSNNVQQLGVMSERLGTSIKFLQKWQRVGRDLNIQSEAMRDGFKELSLRADEFAETGKGPAADVFKRLGLSQEDIASVKGDTEAMFNLVLEKTRDVQGQAARQRIADELFGGQAGEQFTNLLNKSREEIEKLKQSAEEAGGFFSDEDFENAQKFNRQLADFQQAMQKAAKQVVANMLPALSKIIPVVQQEIVPAITGFVSTISGIVEAFAALPGPVQSAIVQFTAFAAVLGPVMSIVGRLVGGIGGLFKLIAKIPGVTGLARAAMMALMAGGLTPIIATVAAVVAAIYLLPKAFTAVKEAGKLLWEGMKLVWDGISTAVEKAWKFIKETVVAGWDAIVAKAKEWGTKLKEQTVGRVMAMWNGVKSILSSIKQGFLDAFNFIYEQTIGRVTDMVDAVKSKVKDMWQALTGNSIIPRMADEAVAEFGKMADAAEREGERTRKGLEGNISNAARKVTMDGSGPGAGKLAEGGQPQQVNVDMSRATFRDDRDMLDRLKRKGSDLTGAFD